MAKFHAFVTSIFLTTVNVQASYAQFIVTTLAGNVSGTTEVGKVNNVSYRAFVNIPYAMPPIDLLRFKAPLTFTTNNTGNINAKTGALLCPQIVRSAASGSEDCLILNVYTPVITDTSVKYPVMVWIHGGAFNRGTSSIYQPEFIVAESVVLVTLNYRLGALGFLSLGNDDAPGNAGLKDQALALQWVNNEISNFNGDPKKITLFGESAGAASVHHHMLSKYSTGLFQQAILQSGNAIENWAYLESGFEDRAKNFAQRLGCVQNDRVIFNCLQNTSVSDIIYNQELYTNIETEIQSLGISFMPVKERNAEGAFHTDSMFNLIKKVVNPVNSIMGINKDEGLFFIRKSDVFFNNFYDNLKYFIPQVARDRLSEQEIISRANKLRMKYFPNKAAPSIYNYQGFSDLYTDSVFCLSTLETANSLLAHNSTPTVYMYRFEYYGDFKIKLTDAHVYGIPGVSHGDDLGYLFYLSSRTTQSTNSEAYNVLRKMVTMWTTFATTGQPIPFVINSTSPLYNVQWYPITATNSNYLSITATPAMVYTNFSTTSTIQLWNEITQSSSFHTKSTLSLIVVHFIATKFLVQLIFSY